ncbi:MAG: radical SAM protein, partial [Caldiserica bacterium]
MKEAVLWEKKNGKIRCELCNHFCLIEEGKTGICGVRFNKNGLLYSL